MVLIQNLPEAERLPEDIVDILDFPLSEIERSISLTCSEDNQSGVVAARRWVSANSHHVFSKVVSRIEPALTEYTHLSSSKVLAVSVLSHYRLRGVDNVPPTDRITESIRSTSKPMLVRLGRLAFLGRKLSLLEDDDQTSVVDAKLVVGLVGQNLRQETRQYEARYLDQDVSLNPYPGDGKYNPHCTLADIMAPARYFRDPRTLTKLNRLAGIIELGDDRIVELEPIRRHTPRSRG
ncbi:MAG: hypothetical protein ACREF7_03610 [Candidatus Saccharimonadales bacterium]